MKTAVQPAGKYPGDVVFVKMQFLGNLIQTKGFLKVVGDVGNDLIADIRAVLVVAGKQNRVRHQIS